MGVHAPTLILSAIKRSRPGGQSCHAGTAGLSTRWIPPRSPTPACISMSVPRAALLASRRNSRWSGFFYVRTSTHLSCAVSETCHNDKTAVGIYGDAAPGHRQVSSCWRRPRIQRLTWPCAAHPPQSSPRISQLVGNILSSVVAYDASVWNRPAVDSDRCKKFCGWYRRYS